MAENPALPRMYAETVPVFLRVLDRLEAMLEKAVAASGGRIGEVLETRPAPGMFPASQQIATAVQFMVRVACPLAGKRAPELRGGMDVEGLRSRIAAARNLLSALLPADFAGAEGRSLRALAGFAELEMDGAALVGDFGLPNLYFHQAMAYLAFKQAGVPLGKADFDGLHVYPEGFAFG